MFYMSCIVFANNSSLVYILMGLYLLKKERFSGMRVVLLLGDFLLFKFFFKYFLEYSWSVHKTTVRKQHKHFLPFLDDHSHV